MLTAARWAHMLAGMFVLAYGIDLTREARLGLGPWDVLHEGLEKVLPVSFGAASIAVGLVLVAWSALLGIKPRAGTVVNMVIVGVFVDAIMHWNLIYPAEQAAAVTGLPPVYMRSAYLLLGAGLSGFGSAWYVTADLGAGPRDAMMLGLSRRWRRPVGPVRTVMEAAALITGWAIGGTVGVGTALMAFSLGWTIQGGLAFFAYLVKVFPRLRKIIRLPQPRSAPGKEAAGRAADASRGCRGSAGGYAEAGRSREDVPVPEPGGEGERGSPAEGYARGEGHSPPAP